ncbi:MAG: hypothetical protein KBG80_01510 [Breznakibacter sp.]|nr:hypothetical protein [Breznakibacter sp.]
MVNNSELVDKLKQGSIALLNLDSGLYVVASSLHEQAVSRLSDLGIIGGESILMLGKSTILDDYILDVPEMANTLLELSDKPLNLRFKKWKEIPSLTKLFADGIVVQISTEPILQRLLGSLKGDLVSILVENRSAKAIKVVSAMVDYVVDGAVVKTPQSVLPGIIEFDEKGALKVIRE